jgi:ribonuclease H2 subunit A
MQFATDNNASPRDISSGMLRRPPTNLNKQSQDATILLIREVLQRGIKLTEVAITFYARGFAG